MRFSQIVDGIEYVDPVCRTCGEPIEHFDGRWRHLRLWADHSAWLSDEVARVCNDPMSNLALQVLNIVRNRFPELASAYESDFLKANWSIERKDRELVYTVRIPLADKL